jgi:hypothetical protein
MGESLWLFLLVHSVVRVEFHEAILGFIFIFAAYEMINKHKKSIVRDIIK